MFGRTKPDALIVGAGPVGLFTALTLARQDVPVDIIDQEWRTGAHSYALALHAASLGMLEDVGILGEVLDQAYRVRSIGLYDGHERRAEMRLADLGDEFSFLAVMRQDTLEELFEQALREHGVKVKWNHQLAVLRERNDHVVATVDKLEKDSVGYAVAHMEWKIARSKDLLLPFVIGADGHRSSVREALELKFDPVRPPQHFAVFEFKTDADLDHEMKLAMVDDTTNVLWPMPEGFCRWSFELTDYEVPGYTRQKDRFAVQQTGFPMLDEAHLRELLAERAPWFSGSIDRIRWQIVVRFEKRLVEAFGRERTWLVGDAGHMTGPAGIQSMNVGLREGRDLAHAVAAVLKQEASMERLADYNRMRQAEWRFLLGMEGDITPSPTADPWIAAQAERLLPCLPASGADLVALMQQVGLNVEPAYTLTPTTR
jgi:2-polyprenyl-6-methoxyphenol hydroxylase-like FAD-dependent oxidoreductase